MSVQTWAGANILLSLFRYLRKGGKLDEAVQAVDKKLDSAFPKRSEMIQQQFVAQLLMPLAEGLMKEDKWGLAAMYAAAAARLNPPQV